MKISAITGDRVSKQLGYPLEGMAQGCQFRLFMPDFRIWHFLIQFGLKILFGLNKEVGLIWPVP